MSLLILLLISLRSFAKADCVSYGNCGYNDYWGSRNCLYNGPPQRISDTDLLSKLENLCPWFFTDNKTLSPLLCCDEDQVVNMLKLAMLPEVVVSRCPACWRNLRTFMCERACSPIMNEFEYVTHAVNYIDEEGTHKLAVNETMVAINYDYMKSIMDSCSDVMLMGSSVLITLCMSSNCTPQKLAESLSSVKIGSPHHSKIFLSNDESIVVDQVVFKPLKSPTFRCDEAIITSNELALPCTCGDCPKVCQEMDFNVEHVQRIGSITVIEFLIIILVLGVVISFVLLIAINMLQASTNSNKYSNFSSSVFEEVISKGFYRLGLFCAQSPKTTICITLMACTILSIGMTHFNATADPIDIWGMINGRCLNEKQYFDEHFGPFFRTTQVILVPKNQTNVIYKNETYGPVFRQNLLLELLDIQLSISQLQTEYNNDKISLKDVCFAPIYPDSDECAIQDIAQYFQNNYSKILQDNWMDHLIQCSDGFYNPECLSVYFAPIFPYVAFAGVPTVNEVMQYTKSNALTITILINNHPKGDRLNKALNWEKAFLEYMQSLTSTNFDLYFNCERSAEDGVAELSKSDISTILISYSIMFIYMSVFLSTFKSIRTVLVDLRICLGFACILMIILSVSSTIGIFSYFKMNTSLIVLQVTPFLLLAISSGDNFVFVKNFDNLLDLIGFESVEEKVARNTQHIGPNLLLTSMAQLVAFGIGGIIPVGAVRMFALYSAVAVVIKFILQFTFFVAVFTLDCKRQEAKRCDIFCCFKQDNSTKIENENKMFFKLIFKRFLSPIILHRFARPIIFVLFMIWFIVSLAFIPSIKSGLNLEAVFPDQSFTKQYLQAVFKYSAVGPPVYIVMKSGYQYQNLMRQNDVCATVGCNTFSIINQATQVASMTNISYIKTPPVSWIDDYFSWISSPACCKVNLTTGSYCYSDHEDCVPCPRHSIPFDQRPLEHDFNQFLNIFLLRIPDVQCPKAGKSLYSTSVEIVDGNVGATNFMGYSSVYRNIEDGQYALEAQRHLSNILSRHIIEQNGFEDNSIDKVNPIFLYSSVDIYYEQYIGIIQNTLTNLIYCITGVIAVTFVLLGFDLQSSLALLIVLIMTMAQLIGSMYFSNVRLNAISVANLIMSIGIAVEFYVHIIRYFSITQEKGRIGRSKTVLENIGVFIFIGVTIPELVSIATMSQAKSELLRLYFFNVYLVLIITCTLNGLVFLPVFLSYFGPPVKKINEKEDDSIEEFNEIKKSTENADDNIDDDKK